MVLEDQEALVEEGVVVVVALVVAVVLVILRYITKGDLWKRFLLF